ncbi:alpha-methylacyl-CoA racemase domain protein [Mycobacterium xenopi 4042]|uniref:Alpha-methylacyl-CoA racemase domain protein n=1 Tax=Mycobacterium xenopi 4042 TaxID=1299334 RepID=X7ZUP1_MYCXE|nr:alpha-methylacyl-CoA racemase domain protein [Mycobacterium xenopi 4042]
MGPLHGIRILELAGIGAAPFGCMLLADMGAEVVRVERAGDPSRPSAIDGAGRKQSDPDDMYLTEDVARSRSI